MARKNENQIGKGEEGAEGAGSRPPAEEKTAMDRFKLLAKRLLNVPYADLKGERHRYGQQRQKPKRHHSLDSDGSSNRTKK
jgi:hypothetical protein